MYNRKFLHQYFNGFVNKMTSLITNKMGGTSKPNYNVFINEFGYVLCCVIPKSLSLYPLNNVVSGYNDILITNILNYGLIGPIKSKPHFIKGSNAITDLNGPLPLHHIGYNH